MQTRFSDLQGIRVENQFKLLVQPKAGIAPLLKGIAHARQSIEITIFRFDRPELESALIKAAARGVMVHALISGSKERAKNGLRSLERRLERAGVRVSRPAGDLMRYHDKLLIIDREILYLLAFNFTVADIDLSRSFAIITREPGLVKEAARLFVADSEHQAYYPRKANFVVSPDNSRQKLSAFISGARHELLIYDEKVTDPRMIRLLKERAAAGVEIRLIGRMAGRTSKRPGKLKVCRLAGLRLHARAIARDGDALFLGSQSLRKVELEDRREAGVIVSDTRIIRKFSAVFESDWAVASRKNQVLRNGLLTRAVRRFKVAVFASVE